MLEEHPWHHALRSTLLTLAVTFLIVLIAFKLDLPIPETREHVRPQTDLACGYAE